MFILTLNYLYYKTLQKKQKKKSHKNFFKFNIVKYF